MPNEDNVSNADTPALPEGVPATPASRAIWVTLIANSGATAAELATNANIGRSTANKILAALETAGAAVREPGGRDGGRSQPDRWQGRSDGANTEPEPAASAATFETPPLGGGGPETQRSVVVPNGRLAKGQLRDLVLAHLRQHGNQEFTPTAIGRALDRSAGASANACERLVESGLVARTGDAPRRYRVTRRGLR